jgi:hypothetical protein
VGVAAARCWGAAGARSAVRRHGSSALHWIADTDVMVRDRGSVGGDEIAPRARAECLRLTRLR